MGTCISNKVIDNDATSLERGKSINKSAQIRPLDLPYVYPKLPTMSTKPCLFVVREASDLLEDTVKSPMAQSERAI